MSVITLTSNNFEKEVFESDKPVLVDFFATWCAPCRAVSPIVDKIAEESDDKKICKIDVDEQPELASRFSVASIPTLIVFKNGRVHCSAVGTKTKREILDMFE